MPHLRRYSAALVVLSACAAAPAPAPAPASRPAAASTPSFPRVVAKGEPIAIMIKSATLVPQADGVDDDALPAIAADAVRGSLPATDAVIASAAAPASGGPRCAVSLMLNLRMSRGSYGVRGELKMAIATYPDQSLVATVDQAGTVDSSDQEAVRKLVQALARAGTEKARNGAMPIACARSLALAE